MRGCETAPHAAQQRTLLVGPGSRQHIDPIVALDFRGRNFAVQVIVQQRVPLPFGRFAEAAAARRHVAQMLTALDLTAELACYLFAAAAIFFEKECAEAAVAAVIESARREGCAIAADIDSRSFGKHFVLAKYAKTAAEFSAAAGVRHKLVPRNAHRIIHLNRLNGNIHRVRGARAYRVRSVGRLAAAHTAVVAFVEDKVFTGARVDAAKGN